MIFYPMSSFAAWRFGKSAGDFLFLGARLHYPQAAVVNSPPTGACVVGAAEVVGKSFRIVPRFEEGWEWASRYCF